MRTQHCSTKHKQQKDRAFRAKNHLKYEVSRRQNQGLFHNQQQRKASVLEGNLFYLSSQLDFDFHKPMHCTLFFILGFSLISNVSAMKEKEIRSLIQKKMILADDLSQKDCQKIVDGITKTATQPDFNIKHILDTLKQPDFKIVCMDRKQNQNELAFYSPAKKSMVFFANEPMRPGTARHEFYHAHHHLQSISGKCKGTHEQMLAPIYPYTDYEINSYHAAFNQGDKNMNRFINLSNLPRAKWTAEHVTFYETYSQAFSKCIPLRVDIPITKEFFNALKRISLPLLNNNYVQTPCTHIFDVFTTAELHMVTLEISTVEDFAKFVMWNINTLLTSQEYKTIHSKYIQIAERETHTLQFINIEASELIYPKVNKKFYEYQTRCVETASDTQCRF